MGYSEYYKKEEQKMNLAKKYKQLFEGKLRSNDGRLLEDAYADERLLPFDKLVDIDELYKVNDVEKRGEDEYMYEDGEEITIPLLTPLGNEKELMATADVDAGITLFSLFSSSIKALEDAGYDTAEFTEELKEYLM